MKDEISHSGIVESVENGHVRVRIMQSSACAGCHAKSLCSSSESKEKIIDVYESSPLCGVGERVTIVGTASMGTFAVVIAFVVPLILLVLTIVIGMKGFALSELASVGGGVLILAAYYLVLWMNRDRISRKLVFRIVRIE